MSSRTSSAVFSLSLSRRSSQGKLKNIHIQSSHFNDGIRYLFIDDKRAEDKVNVQRQNGSASVRFFFNRLLIKW